jgi:hypothetical protein
MFFFRFYISSLPVHMFFEMFRDAIKIEDHAKELR